MIVTQATPSDLPDVAALFDAYRQFYRYPPDRELATRFIAERMEHGESVIFLARDESGQALGFVQLYPSFSSTLAGRVWILYDLFVDPGVRQRGVGRTLMERAARLGRETGAVEINLATATDNHAAQALYESLGYRRDEDFYVYALSPVDAG